MKNSKENISHALQKYLPDFTVEYVVELLFSETISFTIKKPRKTKQGDYRHPYKGSSHQITINGNLNKYAFLITTLHEFAHMQTFIHHGNNVKPHGAEWKSTFQELLLPILKQKKLPSDIQNALVQSLTNLKASSCTDPQLYRVLKKYNPQTNSLLLEDIPPSSLFIFREKTYKYEQLRRTRVLCTDIASNKQYLISRFAEVVLHSAG